MPLDAQELKQTDYWRVSTLFEDLSYNLMVDSVIAGNTRGWVLADDVSGPSTAWIWNRMGTMLVAGNPHNDPFNHALYATLQGQVLPNARRRGIPSMTVHYSPDTWEDKLDDLLPDLRLEKARRRFYTFDRLKINWKEALPQHCVMRRMDDQLLQRRCLKHIENVVGWVLSFWHSTEAFLETGFGFCLLQESVIAGWCLTVYANGRDFELGLATASDYRNRGYATLTAAACLEHTVKNGFIPHWHCDETNAPSIRVAEKVGFVNPTRYDVYTFPL
jgi:RimJ/RimL family protein N-acetyltransferase